jgi:hypothetical protein
MAAGGAYLALSPYDDLTCTFKKCYKKVINDALNFGIVIANSWAERSGRVA